MSKLWPLYLIAAIWLLGFLAAASGVEVGPVEVLIGLVLVVAIVAVWLVLRLRNHNHA